MYIIHIYIYIYVYRYIYIYIYIIVGGWEHEFYFPICSEESSQLTNSYFFRGVGLNHQAVLIMPSQSCVGTDSSFSLWAWDYV